MKYPIENIEEITGVSAWQAKCMSDLCDDDGDDDYI